MLMSRPLRVMIDARMLIGRFAGVCRVVTRLVDELAGREDLRVVALCGSEPFAAWAGRTDIDVVRCDFGRGDRTADRRMYWEATRLPGLIRRANVDVFHATWNSGIPNRCPAPAVLTIHDLIPWDDPGAHFATVRQRWCYKYAVGASARRARRVTTVSDHTRREVMNRLNLPGGRVVTIHNGVEIPRDESSDCEAAADGPETARYVLYVGGHEPRKNVAGVLTAMLEYWERFDTGLELRLTGDVSSLSPDAAVVYRRLPSGAPVRFLGTINDVELSRQYASARAVLMLSLREGFGLPVLEAMAHGCPVVAARRGALPEVVGDAGMVVDPANAVEVADAIHSICCVPSIRAQLIERGGQRAVEFGWDRTADQMCLLYHTVAVESGHPTRFAVVSGQVASVQTGTTR